MSQNLLYNQRLPTTNCSQSRPFLNNNSNSDGYSDNVSQSIYQMNVMTSNGFATQPVDTQDNVPITQALRMSDCKFFHHTPNDDNFYHITCKIILNDSVPSDDYGYYYDYGFFYQHLATNYYVMCKLISHSSILSILNKKIYEIDEIVTDLNNMNRNYPLSLKQRFILEQDLKKVLPFYLMQNHIPNMRTNPSGNVNSSDERHHKIVTTYADPMIHCPNNFDNGLPHQSGGGGGNGGDYVHNASSSQQQIDSNNIPKYVPEMRIEYVRNANSNENFVNNVVTTQVDSTTGYFNNNSLSHHHSQQDSLNKFSQHQIPESDIRPNYHNIGGNATFNTITQAVSTTDDIRHRNVYAVENYTHPRQYHIPEREINENIGNNVTTTQTQTIYDSINGNGSVRHHEEEIRSSGSTNLLNKNNESSVMITQTVLTTGEDQVHNPQ